MTLSRQLSTEHGAGLDEKNLRRMVQFTEVFPDAISARWSPNYAQRKPALWMRLTHAERASAVVGHPLTYAAPPTLLAQCRTDYLVDLGSSFDKPLDKAAPAATLISTGRTAPFSKTSCTRTLPSSSEADTPAARASRAGAGAPAA
ncbi:MAG: hypothetical protein Q8R33_22695 [Burkholderiales bacterium]|nr:hypothetical protein [Burkholderiales bacterium]